MTIKQQETCSICGEGQLEPQVEKNAVEYNGHTGLLDSHYSVCNACGSEQANMQQTRDNKRAMLAFKKQVDGLLTGVELKALRQRLGINQAQAAAIFGGGPVAFSKYESDDVMQSEAMDKLLRVAEAFPEVLSYLAKNANLPTEFYITNNPGAKLKAFLESGLIGSGSGTADGSVNYKKYIAEYIDEKFGPR
jgi:HTH-type transcriptional regulator/antitoxin MqsA